MATLFLFETLKLSKFSSLGIEDVFDEVEQEEGLDIGAVVLNSDDDHLLQLIIKILWEVSRGGGE